MNNGRRKNDYARTSLGFFLGSMAGASTLDPHPQSPHSNLTAFNPRASTSIQCLNLLSTSKNCTPISVIFMPLFRLWAHTTTAGGVLIAASPRRLWQPSSRGNNCNRSDTHPTGSALRTGPGEVLPFPFFSLKRDIELNPGPNCYTCRKPIRQQMDYLQCQACTNGSHKQLRWDGFNRSHLANAWRCPPHRVPGQPNSAPTTSSICEKKCIKGKWRISRLLDQGIG